MKRSVIISIVCIMALCLPLATVFAEEIISYDVDVSVKEDGRFRVSETILYDFGSEQRHGIYRHIPLAKVNQDGKQRNISLSDITITDGQHHPYIYTENLEQDIQKIRIGDPQTTVSGKQIYKIGYTVSGGLTYFSDHDELYWQVTGTNWEVPISSSSFRVILPTSVPIQDVKIACFTGKSEDTNTFCDTAVENGKIIIRSQKQLAPKEGLTGVVGFPKGSVAVLEPELVKQWKPPTILYFLFIGIGIIGILFWYFILPVWIIVHWYRVGRDPKPSMGIASAWFDVPKTRSLRPLTPAETGTLIDETVSMREITATIIDLARRGYIKIVEKNKKDFYLQKLHALPKTDKMQVFEKTLYHGIFTDGISIRIKDADFIKTVASVKRQLYEAVVAEEFFVSNPEEVRKKYIIIGTLAIITFNIPLIIAAFIFGRAMPKKTVSGAQNAAIATSLRNFITSQKRQYVYQAKNQIFFEKFLPYAIAFGVETIWADRFKDSNLHKPDWYEGYEMKTFNSVYFVRALQTSITSFTSAATPTRSSSGFSSGFSGGSVGGGGGGGGGGSW